MISSKLLTAVLEVPATPHFKRDGGLYYSHDTVGREPARPVYKDIHKLSYMIKEWANSKGYSYIGNKGLVNIHYRDGAIGVVADDRVGKWYGVEVDYIAGDWIVEHIEQVAKEIADD